MRFIGVREFRSRAARVFQGLRKDNEVVITSNGKPVAILTPTSGDQLEDNLAALRTARAIRAVSALQTRSLRLGTDKLTSRDIETEVRAVRRRQRRK